MLALLTLPSLLLASAPIPADFVPPVLHAHSVEFGTTAPTSSAPPATYLGLVPGTTLRYVVSSGAADGGNAVILAVAPGLAATPIPLGSGFLELDPSAIVVLAAGVLDPTGAKSFDFPISAGALVGAPLAAQAATIDVTTLELRTSNALTHAVTDLAPTVIETFFHSGHPAATSAGALVLSNAAEWQAFWSTHHSGIGFPPAPTVDFATKVVVVGFGGWFGTGSYSLKIDALEPLAGGGLNVRQTLSTPGAGCAVSFGETKPGQIVVVDRVAGSATVAATTQVVPKPPCP